MENKACSVVERTAERAAEAASPGYRCLGPRQESIQNAVRIYYRHSSGDRKCYCVYCNRAYRALAAAGLVD